jgi:hypothetical protein
LDDKLLKLELESSSEFDLSSGSDDVFLVGGGCNNFSCEIAL